MTKRIIFFLFFITINVSAFAQNEKMNWHFGNYAALDFNSGSPILITTSALQTQEGCSSVSDANGNLLFYTDGISVWNKNNLVMPNGSGLLGNPSTTQAALITPRPGSTSQYYVFTINELGGAITYSIVDMTLGGGLGGVILASKNTLLHPTVSEKQAAIKRCDGNIWIISHNASDNTFFCDLITPSGINPTVSTSVGLSHAGGLAYHTNTIGQLKISPLGNKLALAIRDVGVFELFDFDINTGIVSNSQPLNTGNYPVAYGVEFSPDATKLYGSTIVSGQIFQFDLTLGTTSAIANSATLIGTAVAYVGDLQAAPDGKIYAAQCYNQTTGGINSLCVINSPNSLGNACGYVQSGLSLGSKSSSLGLPNLMTTNINLIQTNTSNDTTICAGQNIILTANGGDSYQWSGGSSATTNSINVSPPNTTNYIVSISSICGHEIDTITVNIEMPPQFSVSNDTTICSGQSVILTASGSSSYQWSGGSSATTNSINVSPTDTTTYYVTGDANVCGSDTDTIQVNIDQISSISVSNDTSICLGESVTLIASGFTSYQWSGGNSATSSSINVNPTTTTNYYVSSSNSCGNDKDTVVVNILPIPTVFAGNDTSICENQSISLNSNTTNAISHSWDNNIMDGVDFIPQIGNNIYTLTATNSFGCTETDQISVTVHPLPNVSAGANISVCDGSLATLTASGANTYSWNNGVNNGVAFSPDSTTQYSVIGTDTFGCINSDSLFLTIIDIPTVDFVGDSLLGCAPLKTIFKNNSIGNLTNCTWTFSDGSTLFGCDSVVKIFTANTCFDVTLTVSTPQGCTNTKTINNYVCVKPTPTADFSTSPEELKFDELKANMINSSNYATSYNWIFEDGIGISNEFEPAYTFSYDDSKSYNITLIAINDSSGCSDTITKVIFVDQELIFYVPNTFTPDNNQNNEVFLPIFSSGYDPYGYSLYIFDRWGEILFESHDVKIGWDGTYGGKKVQDGTYIWKINIKKSDTDERKEFIGHITVLK